MSEYRRLIVSQSADVTVVRFVDHKILDVEKIQQFGEELFRLVERDKRKSLLLNFENVEFLSSAALNKLIFLDKKIKTLGGRLRLCQLRPEIQEVFVITRLTQLFEICEDEADGLAAFAT